MLSHCLKGSPADVLPASSPRKLKPSSSSSSRISSKSSMLISFSRNLRTRFRCCLTTCHPQHKRPPRLFARTGLVCYNLPAGARCPPWSPPQVLTHRGALSMLPHYSKDALMLQVVISGSDVLRQLLPARSSLILDSLSHTGRWAGHARQVRTVGAGRGMRLVRFSAQTIFSSGPERVEH